MKIIRIIVALLATQLLATPCLKATWEQATWMDNKNIAIGDHNTLWSFNTKEEPASFEEKLREYILEKWNNKEKKWNKKATLMHTCRGTDPLQIIVAADGSVFMTISSYATPEYKTFMADIIKRTIHATLQEFPSADKNNLVEKFDTLCKKINPREAFSEIIGELPQNESENLQSKQISKELQADGEYQGIREITPLYQFIDGKIEKIFDIPFGLFGLYLVGAANSKELWITHIKSVKNKKNNKQLDREIWLGKFDGSTLQPVARFDADYLNFGANNVPYSASYKKNDADNSYTLALSKLDGSQWKNLKPITLPKLFNPQTIRAKDASNLLIINDNDIWVTLHSPEKSLTEFFHWNGKKLDPKKHLATTIISPRITSTSNHLFIQENKTPFTSAHEGTWYQWVDTQK